MKIFKDRLWRGAISALLVAGVLAGCGGNDSTKGIDNVYFMGDSLSDVGTFGGVKFTVQDTAHPENSLLWTQHVDAWFGLNGLNQCNYFSFTSTFTENVNCTNYSVAGARLRAKDADGGTNSPRTISKQLSTRAQKAAYTSRDLVLINGGANDVADLAASFVGLPGALAYEDFLSQQLDRTTVVRPLLDSGAQGRVAAAGLYMNKLSENFYADITTSVLNKGSAKVVILNIPDMTLTPYVKSLLAQFGTINGPVAKSVLELALRQIIIAFNANLQTLVKNNDRIVLVDHFSDSEQQAAKPASFGLDNVTTAVCTEFVSAATGTFPCLSSTLNAQPGKVPGWWETYAFADGIHPTPRVHKLISQSVIASITKAGWFPSF